MIFEALPDWLQIPSLHPAVAIADSWRDRRLNPVFWFYEDNRGICLKSFYVVETMLDGDLLVRDIEYPYGYGGVLFTCSDASFALRSNELFKEWASSQGILLEFARIHPLLKGQSNYFSSFARNRDTIYIDLGSDFVSRYRKKRRWSIKKELAKSIKIKKSKSILDVECFKEMYFDTMHRVSASKFYYFPNSYFELLSKLDVADLWLAYYQDNLRSAAFVLHRKESGIAEYHLGAYSPSKDDCPMELLIHLMAKSYSGLGYKQFYLGGGRSCSEGDSLLRFKQSFSSNTLPFYVGSNVFEEQGYELLKSKYNGLTASSRIIFYRD